ncbi:MAG: sensor histidine kinase [Candidatus Kapaibacterium sp.]
MPGLILADIGDNRGLSRVLENLERQEMFLWIISLVGISILLIAVVIAFYMRYLERSELIKKLRESESKLREVNETKDKFFSIIAHDLKNPVAAMKDSSAILAREYNEFDDADRHEMIREISRQSANVYELLDHLLTWARSQQGRISFRPERFDVGFLVKNNIGFLQGPAYAKNISIKNEIRVPTNVYGDQNMISAVIQNLLSNAIKFTPKGGSVTIDSRQISRAGRDFEEVSVTDTGIGIEEKKLMNLFTPGGVISTPGTSQESGTGLGLVISREFVEHNGGTIYAESKPEGGTTMRFTIPKSAED